MLAVKIFSAIVGFVAAVALTNWFDDYTFWIIAVIGGIAGGVIVYGFLVSLLSRE